MKIQLWNRDEYGQGSIFGSSDSMSKAIDSINKEVNSSNVDNSLTIDDKKRNWEAYSVALTSKNKKYKTLVYGGKDGHGEHIIYGVKKDETAEIIDMDENVKEVRIYLGELDNKIWFAETNRGRIIESLSAPELIGKTVYFVKVL